MIPSEPEGQHALHRLRGTTKSHFSLLTEMMRWLLWERGTGSRIWENGVSFGPDSSNRCALQSWSEGFPHGNLSELSGPGIDGPGLEAL